MKLPSLEVWNGYLWPTADQTCRSAISCEMGPDLEVAYRHVTDWSVVVQAGGNCGVWPSALSQRFETVYTFEPDPVNFHCLARNCEALNVVKFQTALGDWGEHPMGLVTRPENCGAHYLGGAGFLPVIPLDALGLQRCGLLYLDIEGYEHRAIAGATSTIRACRPVIVIENKGMSDKYGVTVEQTEALVLSLGYRVVDRPHRDVVFVPC